jgi:rhodanese-related sulfurtransferase
MARTITANQLRHHWANRYEIALLDVREEGPYAEAHPFFAITVPVSEVEYKLPALVPRLSVPIVVYDDGEGYVERAAARISAMGYRDVSILEGGLSGYALVGEVFRDVNVPSKAFGELVEAIRHTPSMPAREIKQVLENDKNIVVLDARRFEEYNTMSIPRGQSCPGGELLYRLFEVAPDPSTTVIVHCAGRTRSIVGAQSLVNVGVRNKVVALENGTIGWTLAGLGLDKGKVERAGPPSSEAVQKARQYAKRWAKHVGVSVIDGHQLKQFIESAEDRTLYLLDVRDPREYAEGHPDGFLSAPGGQLVQATDEWVGVRGARIVLYDTDGVRALMAGSWLLQLGYDVNVLEENASVPGGLPIAEQPTRHVPSSSAISVEGLESLVDATIVDLARSPVYRKGHIPGAWFASGPELARDLNSVPGSGTIVLTSPDGNIAAMNVEYARKGVANLTREILYLNGGTAAWTAAGHPLETEQRWLSEPIDIYKRPYEGTENAEKDMQGYIDWEHGLVAQVANDSIACFHVARDMPL